MPTLEPSLHERFERLERDLQPVPPGFLRVSDMPYAIFHYVPCNELALCRELNSI